MKMVAPKAILLAETKIDAFGLGDLLQHLGVGAWSQPPGLSDAERLTEIAGKLCYMSFSTDLNDNLTAVNTKSNFDYVQQSIIKNLHGSVLEHSTVSIVALDVSRVATHELVRHRPGSAYSQQSGRYVRTDHLHMYIPPDIIEDQAVLEKFLDLGNVIEKAYNDLVEASGLDDMKDFDKKKRITSALRRLRPNGESNAILFTYNHRAYRHLIEVRTSPGAEEEIRVLFNQVFQILRERYPAIYADATVTPHELEMRAPVVTFKYPKV